MPGARPHRHGGQSDDLAGEREGGGGQTEDDHRRDADGQPPAPVHHLAGRVEQRHVDDRMCPSGPARARPELGARSQWLKKELPRLFCQVRSVVPLRIRFFFRDAGSVPFFGGCGFVVSRVVFLPGRRAEPQFRRWIAGRRMGPPQPRSHLSEDAAGDWQLRTSHRASGGP
jgi:hypothetical protein